MTWAVLALVGMMAGQWWWLRAHDNLLNVAWVRMRICNPVLCLLVGLAWLQMQADSSTSEAHVRTDDHRNDPALHMARRVQSLNSILAIDVGSAWWRLWIPRSVFLASAILVVATAVSPLCVKVVFSPAASGEVGKAVGWAGSDGSRGGGWVWACRRPVLPVY